jgi:hypothetical protein
MDGRIPNVQILAMNRLLLLALMAACQNGSTSAAPPPAKAGSGVPQPFVTDGYRNDIGALCDVMKQSGADQQPPDARQAIIAMWLGPHITTDEGRNFLVAIQPLQGEAKAQALDSEARRVGLGSCPLASEWRGSGATSPH